MNDYRGPAWFQVTVLPSRAAYLIRPGSRPGFRRAVQEATTRWGGATEPIVPVGEDGGVDGWYHKVVQLSGVEAVVNVDVDVVNAGRAAERFALPLVDLQHIDSLGPTHWTTHPSSLPASSAQTPVIASTEGALWQVALAGDVTSDHETELANNGIQLRRPPTADQVARASVRKETLLDRTLSCFLEHSAEGGAGSTPAIFWACQQDSLVDCLEFWNLRVLRPLGLGDVPMLLLPAADVEHWVEFPQDVQRLLTRLDEFSPDVLLTSVGLGEEQLQRIADDLHFERSTEDVQTGHRWPATMRKAPFTYIAADHTAPRSWFDYIRRYGMATDVQAHVVDGSATLAFASPVNFTGGGLALLEVQSGVFNGLPRRDVVAQQIVPSASWNEAAIKLRTWAVPQYRFDIQIPTLPAAAQAVLGQTVSSHALSDKGRLGMPVVAEAIQLFKPGVYEAVAALTTPRSKDLYRELRKLRDGGGDDADLLELAVRWGGRAERRYRSTAELGPIAGRALERLCALGWAHRGAEVNCDHCGVRSFVQLRDINGAARCPGCGEAQSYSTTSDGGPAIVYRLTTFIDRASDQGVLPHLLAVGALMKRSMHTYLLPGVDVLFPAGGSAEVDLLGVHDGLMVAGEVKTTQGAFTPEQMTRDFETSLKRGVDIHVMATVDTFSRSLVEAAQSLAHATGLQLLALDAQDLRPGENP